MSDAPSPPAAESAAEPDAAPAPLCLMIGMQLDGKPSDFSGWLTATIYRRDPATFSALAAHLRDLADRIEADYAHRQ